MRPHTTDEDMNVSMPESSRNRSVSLEAAGPEKDRKRPRLDSHNDDQLNSEEALTHSRCPEHNTLAASISALQGNHDHSTDAPPHDSAKMATSPTRISSRVTINTRSSQPQSAPQHHRPESAHLDSTKLPSDGTANAARTTSTSDDNIEMSISAPEVITVNSSPSRSPEIQIAELEDLDQDPTETRWTPISRVTSKTTKPQIYIPRYVFNTFPFARTKTSVGRVGDLIPQVAKVMQTGGGLDTKLFLDVKDWLLTFLRDHSQVSLEMVLEEQDFWTELPEVVTGLLRRQIDAPSHIKQRDLEELLVAYGQLTILFLQLDIAVMKTYGTATESEASIEPLSKAYLPTLAWLLSYRDIQFYEVLRLSREFSVPNLVSAVMDLLASDDIDIMHHLSTFVDQIATHIIKRPALSPTFLQAIVIISQFARSGNERVLCAAGDQYRNSPQLSRINDKAAGFFVKVDALLRTGITKQLPWLTIENSPDLLRTVSRSLQCILEQDAALGKRMAEDLGLEISEVPTEESSDIVAYAWKFSVLRKYITLGRMELRVYGVETMQQDLVHVWKCHIQYNADCMTVPLVRYLVGFLQSTKMVEYIVGVDSHPQLINRSANLVGFLCVTSTYTDADTDTIWRTVTLSQDPRTVADVLNLLRSILSMSQLSSTLYLCEKLLDISIERFDARMVDFAHELLNAIRHKSQHPNRGEEVVNVLPFRLCIRLIRDSSATQTCPPEQKRSLQTFGSEQLDSFLRTFNVSMQDKNDLWRLCVEDIAAKNSFATGSLYALQAWVAHQPSIDVPNLANDFNLTNLLITDLIHLVQSAWAISADVASLDNALRARLWMLSHLIACSPRTITGDLSELLWTELLASRELPQSIRDYAWVMLSERIHLCRSERNDFFDTFIAEYLPKLGQDDFSAKILEFVQQSVLYEAAFEKLFSTEEENIVSIPGIDRVWRFIMQAPPGTVEIDATNWVIKQYLDHEIVLHQPNAVITATHLTLVERCVKEVVAAAARLKSFTDGTISGEDEPMVIIASEAEIRADEMRFDRSLLFLRQFLHGMKTRPRYSPPPTSEPGLPRKSFEDRGSIMQMKYQCQASNRNNPMIHFTMGSLNTADELGQYLVEMTGFTQFSCFAGGRKVQLFENKTTLQDMRIGPGLLLIQKVPNTLEKLPKTRRLSVSVVDTKVMDHFDELYDLLDLDERLSREVYTFLDMFPPQPRLQALVRSCAVSADELLPPDKPYRLLYCANTLRSCIEDEALSAKPDAAIVQYTVKTIIATFSRSETPIVDKPLGLYIAHRLVECLGLALRAQVSSEVSASYISDRQGFARHLLAMVENARDCSDSDSSGVAPHHLIRESLGALIEGSLHDERVWDSQHFISQFPNVLASVILHDCRVEVRKAAADVFLGLSGSSGTKLLFKTQDPRSARSRFPISTIDTCLTHIWRTLVEIIPLVKNQASQSQQLFEVVLAVLRCVGKSLPVGDLNTHFRRWADLLVGYRHKEIIGKSLDDYIVWGFAKLLSDSYQLLQSEAAITSNELLAESLLSTFLFPPLSASKSPEVQSRIPVLKESIRDDLYNLVLMLSKGQDGFDMIVGNLEDIVPKGGFPIEWAFDVTFAQTLEDHYFEPNVLSDRQALRSEVGYAGLRNLSNTCYLNSLFSQLFMNLAFRKFILEANIVDEAAQRLVAELSKLFSHMQNSWGRAVDPSSAVESIRTYENEQIDVSVQMDVDEFFNLLFDRLEGQMLASTAKQAFRSLYGGQLVQQIKSRECQHISERLEPFSAIQCEIKGKAGLVDSLRAYVEGEMMQGDNKYSCTSCGRHVDAIKRACLKDIPNHLIFNLKRFDFDITTMTRCKINDEFQFPDIIDMAPYAVESLSNPEQPVVPDIFELVGVLVHSGTAESGHYYSYVRERPSSKNSQDSWVQFNDSDVSGFDPARIGECCFGGMDESLPVRLPRVYSAYTLFYQRVSSIRAFEVEFPMHDVANPVRLTLSPEMESYIALENELFIRSYCAQDPSHARFVRLLLERMRWGENNQCSRSHESEDKTLAMVLDYVHQISCRFKEMPELESTMKLLQSYACDCESCATTIAKWYLPDSHIRDTVLRNPQAPVRRSFVHLLHAALHKLKVASEQHSIQDQDDDEATKVYEHLYTSCAEILDHQWDDLYKFSRAWNDYFDLLTFLANLGHWESLILLELQYLERVMEIIWVDGRGDQKKLKKKYTYFIHMREKGRTFSQTALLSFLATLLERLDLGLVVQPNGYRTQLGEQYSISSDEQRLLWPSASSPRGHQKFDWLRRITNARHNPVAVGSIIATLAKEPGVSPYVKNTLVDGLACEQVSEAVAFLEPTLIFCSNCTDPRLVVRLAEDALDDIESINYHYGKEHLDFVIGLISSKNRSVHLEQEHFLRLVLKKVAIWGPPLLIFPEDQHTNVAAETVDLINQYLLSPVQKPDLDSEDRDFLVSRARELAVGCANYVTSHFIPTGRADTLYTLEPGQGTQLERLVEHILEHHFQADDADDESEVGRIQGVMAQLRTRSHQTVAEEQLSESWQDNDSLGGSDSAPSDLEELDDFERMATP